MIGHPHPRFKIALILVVVMSLATGFGPGQAMAAKHKAPHKTARATTKAESAAKAKAQAEARYASIVMDAYTGRVLQATDPDKVLYPASLTKIMTLFMVFDALDRGKLKLNQSLPVSSHAASMAPSKLNLRPGDTISVENAVYAVATKSANDAAVTLAEALGGGSEAQFARLMTERAHQIGMKNSNFRNASGLPNRYQASSARDMAILARTLIARFPEYYHYFATRQFTYNGVTHANHNKLLGKYPGLDGIKTGFINASGFNLVASAEQNGRRMIGVIFGGTSSQARNTKMVQLLNAGFVDANSMNLRLAQDDPGKKSARKKMADNNNSRLVPVSPPAPKPELETEPAAQIPEPSATKTVNAHEQDKNLPASIFTDTSDDEDDTTETNDVIKPKQGETSYWSIQIGAYNDKKGGETAIDKVKKLAPTLLADAAATIVPITTQRGTLYRARMAGFNEEDAHRACKEVQKAKIPCMPLRSITQ